jgi:hypothetical protein
LPAAWRDEILRAARAGGPQASAAALGAERPGLGSRWRDWLGPHPVAWGGLAAAWVLIVLLHQAGAGPGAGRAGGGASAAPAVMAAILDQWQRLGPPVVAP